MTARLAQHDATIAPAAPGGARPTSANAWFGRPYAYAVALTVVWLLCAALFCYLCRQSIAGFQFIDTDDAMRLLQVRDWLAGQSWFDVTQYRLDPPAGLHMHWSRLLDVPLAVMILLVRPLAGEHVAEIAACAVVPMLTLGATMALVAGITRRFAGPWLALLAAAYCVLDVGTFYAMRPMRIDHHGWQIVAGLGVVHALTGRPSRQSAAIAGLCAALWMHISLEGIAFAAFAAGWLGLRWILAPAREGDRLPIFLAAIAAGSLMFFLVAHGGDLFGRTFCDAISPVHIVSFAVAAAGVAATLRLAPDTVAKRALGLAISAAACAACYRLWAPQCAAGGPFDTLTPLDYRIWYLHVGEGLPLCGLPLSMILTWLLFPLVGMAGAVVLLLRGKAEHRAQALDLAALLFGAVLIGLTVRRAGAFSNLLAITGAVSAMVPIHRALADPRPRALRVLVSAMLPFLLMPLTPSFAASLADDGATTDDGAMRQTTLACESASNIAHLDAVPPTMVLAPLDVTPFLLLGSRHAALAGGYHRDPMAMNDVLRFFTGGERDAHAIATARHAKLVAFCPSEGDMRGMRRIAPEGMAARLMAGRPPQWLKPVAIPQLKLLRVYAVTG